MLMGLVLRLLTNPRQLWISLVIWAGAILVIGLLAVYAIVGWGDIKLMAAVTLLVPSTEVLQLVLAIMIMGGAISCLYLVLGRMVRLVVRPGDARRRGLMQIIEHEIVRINNELSRIGTHRTIPYAVAILLGVAYHDATVTMRCWPAIYC
jgi:prepilin peptidase CpaA